DVTFDLISVQYHALKAGHDYGQYVRDARNAEREGIAAFSEEAMAQDAERATKCHEFLRELGGTDNTSPQPGAPPTPTAPVPAGARAAVAPPPAVCRAAAGRRRLRRAPPGR